MEQESLDDWIQRNELSKGDFEWLIRDQAQLRHVETLLEADVAQFLPDHLRVSGDYGRVRARASAKRRVLMNHGLDDASVADSVISEQELWRWYFQQRNGYPVPQDLCRYARTAGFSSVDALRRAAIREFLFTSLTEDASESVHESPSS